MNRLSKERQAALVAALVEGNSIRSTVRMTGVAKNTVVKLLVHLGRACDQYQHRRLVNLRSKRLQMDAIWSFVYAKKKDAPEAMKVAGQAGDVWTWTCVDADTKLMVSWLVGSPIAGTAFAFVEDVAARVANRVQITTDGRRVYLAAVDAAFAGQVDYAQLVKIYGEAQEGHRRYSPPACTATKRESLLGRPDLAHVSTSFVERANLTMRMNMRRFTRLTNAFSKKVENHATAVVLFFMHYNFARVHQTLRVTPAMEAGIADHVWTLSEIVGLLS
jgi:IS1 family transposase